MNFNTNYAFIQWVRERSSSFSLGSSKGGVMVGSYGSPMVAVSDVSKMGVSNRDSSSNCGALTSVCKGNSSIEFGGVLYVILEEGEIISSSDLSCKFNEDCMSKGGSRFVEDSEKLSSYFRNEVFQVSHKSRGTSGQIRGGRRGGRDLRPPTQFSGKGSGSQQAKGAGPKRDGLLGKGSSLFLSKQVQPSTFVINGPQASDFSLKPDDLLHYPVVNKLPLDCKAGCDPLSHDNTCSVQQKVINPLSNISSIASDLVPPNSGSNSGQTASPSLVGGNTVHKPISSWKSLFSPSIKTDTKLKFYEPLSINGEVVVKPPEEVAIVGARDWSNCLVGHFIDERVPFKAVKETVSRKWGRVGGVEIHSLENGFFLFRFESEEGKNWVLDSGPWDV